MTTKPLPSTEERKEKAQLNELFIKKNLTPAEVAAELGISQSAVYRKLRKYNIEKPYELQIAALRRRRGL